MTTIRIPLPVIETAIRDVCQVLEQQICHAPPWKQRAEEDLWRELVACILGSRVHFNVAHAATRRMEKARLFSKQRRSSEYDKYERDVVDALWCDGRDSSATGRYPFPKLRGSQIRTAAERFYAQGATIRSLLETAQDVREARRRLATEVAGLGPKQASLFLRNIGYATHVAVLDVHVLTYMNWVGLTPTPMKSVRTVSQYETLEDVFIEHSHSAGYAPDHFDVAVWVVVRVAKKECETWR